MNWSGRHRGYKREDGHMHSNERHTSSLAELMERIAIWLIAGLLALILGALVYLAKGQGVLQQQMAMLMERTTNQNARMDQNAALIQSVQIHEAELQRQMDELRVAR